MTVDEVNGIDRLERILAEEEDVAERLDPRVERAYRARDEAAAVAALYGHRGRSGQVTPLGSNTFNNDDAPAISGGRGA